MQCSCGGYCVDRQFTKEGVKNLVKRCLSCGRQHIYAEERVVEIDAEDEQDALAMAKYLTGDMFVSAELVSSNEP